MMDDASRERFEDLVDAYVLGALPEHEREEVERYLEVNPRARAELDELRSVAGLLALSPADREPPPELRERLMRIVRAEAGVGDAAERGGEQRFPWLANVLNGRNVSWGLAAMVLVGLVSWNLLLQTELNEAQDGGTAMETIRFTGSEMPEGSSAEVLAFSRSEAVLIAEDLPELEADETLQIWVIEGDTPYPAGTFQPRDGMVTVPVTHSIDGADALAVTIEPDGGSQQPTSEPMMTANV